MRDGNRSWEKHGAVIWCLNEGRERTWVLVWAWCCSQNCQTWAVRSYESGDSRPHTHTHTLVSQPKVHHYNAILLGAEVRWWLWELRKERERENERPVSCWETGLLLNMEHHLGGWEFFFFSAGLSALNPLLQCFSPTYWDFQFHLGLINFHLHLKVVLYSFQSLFFNLKDTKNPSYPALPL